MEALLSKHSEKIFALTRIFLGVMYMMHGLQKFGVFSDGMAGAPLFLVAGAIEVIGGALIAVGFFTRWAAILASGEMAAAFFIAHWPQGVHPLLNGGELTVIYAWFFLYVAARGAGIWSADAAREDTAAYEPGLAS